MDVAVHWREIGGELADGLGIGLGQSLAGMNRACSKCVACGSIVTGLIKLGGEIMDGSNGGLVPGLDCFLRELWELGRRERLGKAGGGFLRRDDEEDMLDISYFMLAVVGMLELWATGVVGRVCALGSAGTGGGGGSCLGGVEAGR